MTDTTAYNDAIEDVHELFADFYDEEFKRNKVNAMRNISSIIKKLKDRVEALKK